MLLPIEIEEPDILPPDIAGVVITTPAEREPVNVPVAPLKAPENVPLAPVISPRKFPEFPSKVPSDLIIQPAEPDE